MGVTSTLIFTRVDEAGTPRTEAWLTLDFSGSYAGDGGYAGGQAFDLSPYFRRIEHMELQPLSGATLRDVVSGGTREFRSGQHVLFVPVVEDYPNPVSARIQLWGHPLPFISGSPATSGFGITQLVSGPAAAISGIRCLAKVLGA